MNETSTPTASCFAPVALFVYNSIEHTKATMKHLLANTLASETDIYVFSDGGKDDLSQMLVVEVRKYLRETQCLVRATKAAKSMMVIERSEHYGAKRNLWEGIAAVLERQESLIVLADHIMTSPYFLAFMNQALTLYHDVPEVSHVCGFSPLDLRESLSHHFYFSAHTIAWGWGTWRNRLHGQSLPTGGVCLMPTYTLVKHIALNSGFSLNPFRRRPQYDRWPLFQPLEVTHVEQPQSDPAIERQMEVVTQEIKQRTQQCES